MDETGDTRRELSMKLRTLKDANPWLETDSLERHLDLIVSENSSFKVRSAKLIAVADQFVKALERHVACHRGCDQCCHMATPIFQHEAERIAHAYGLKISEVPYRPHQEVLDIGLAFYGTPCPFLSSGECSVYEFRPLICRAHHSLNADASQCNTTVPLDQKSGVAMFNPDFFELPYIKLTMHRNPKEPWGYFQEFFPDLRRPMP